MVNIKKSKFLVGGLKYLGYWVEGNCLQPNYHKMDTLLTYKIPRSVKDVHSLYGLLSYFRPFVPGFAQVA